MADWLYAEAGKLASLDENLCEKIKSESLHPAVFAFVANVQRIHSFWRLYPHVVEQATTNVVNTVDAVFSLTGRPFMTDEERADPEFIAKVKKKIHEYILRKLESGAGSFQEASGYDFENAISRFGNIIRSDPGSDEAIYATFSAQLTSAWTAFEALATDLWEYALNGHPKTLATLVGVRNRISKAAGAIGRDKKELGYRADREEFEPKLSDFARITRDTYNASELMGSLLRDEFKFQTLAGLRAAYSAAFSKNYSKLDVILSDHSLDKLNIVRNLLLHKAGIVDVKFLEAAKSIPWDVPLAEEEKPIMLTGAFVRAVIDPVIRSGAELIETVDQWMETD